MTAERSSELRSKSADARFDALVESYLDAIRRGDPTSIAEYAKCHPDLAARIESVFPTLQAIERPPAGDAAIGRLGEFRILREIGRGGMGVVYAAEQESLGRLVALKVLPSSFLADERRLERFRREARAAASLTHPSIVPVYGMGDADGHHFFVMQYIPGHGLDAVIAELRRIRESGSWPGSGGGPLPAAPPSSAEYSAQEMLGVTSDAQRGSGALYFRNVARFGVQAARAVASAHAQGILHRDIKPSNLLIAGGHLWVADFGLAKTEGVEDLTRSGEVVGTIRYMAPERFRGEATSRSDVYSLALALYELLTLKPAFDDLDRGRLLRKVMEDEPEPPRRINPEVPIGLEAVVLCAAAKLPERRYPSAEELAADLERFVEGAQVMAKPTSGVAHAVEWLSRRRTVVGLTAITASLVWAAVMVASHFWHTPEKANSDSVAPAEFSERAAVSWKTEAREIAEGRLKLYPTGSGIPWGIAATDMNSDGRLDLVIVNHGERDEVTVLLNEGQRVFRDTGEHAAVGKFPLKLVAADFNGDGEPDLSTVNRDSKDVSVLRNLGGGNLGAAEALPLEGLGYSLAAGDFDGDHDIDLAAARPPGIVRLFMNEGNGSFTAHRDIQVGHGAEGLFALDLDRDSRTDLLGVLAMADRVFVLLAEDGRKLGPPRLYPCFDHPTNIAASDLDGDGDLDLTVVGHKADAVALFLNEGAASLRLHTVLPAPKSPFSCAAADVNGDGRSDVIVNDQAGAIAVLLNAGVASFKQGLEFATGGEVFQLIAADLDADSRADVAATNGLTGTVVVLYGD